MRDDSCGLCHKRISNWEMVGGKCTVIYGKLVHNACLMDKKPSEVKNQIEASHD